MSLCDAASDDPLFADLPRKFPVISWHRDEITCLPMNAVPMTDPAAPPSQAFRVGDRAWGVQFHIECDAEMIASWVAASREPIARPEELVRSLGREAMADIEVVWRPFAERFASVVAEDLRRLNGRVRTR
jgi:hypothetical protein